MMNQLKRKPERDENLAVSRFMDAIQADARITPYHVSLFAAIVHYKQTHGCASRIFAFSYDLMPLAKISSVATYHKCVRDLHDFGYIDYEASFNRFTGSKIILK